MPHLQPLLTTQIQGQLAAVGVVGKDSIRLSLACSTAYVLFMTTIVKVLTVDSGVVGAGVGFGKIVGVLGPAYAAACAAQAAANGLVGTHGPLTCSAIGLACGNHTSAVGQSLTFHAGVGVGFGTGTLVGSIPTALFGLLLSQGAAQGLIGTSVVNLFNAIANGIAPLVPTAIVLTPIAGSPIPIPSAGAGFGSVL